MSVATKLTTINSQVAAAHGAVTAKGGTGQAGTSTLAAAINSIPAGGGAVFYKCESINLATGTWSGYKAELSAETGKYEFAATLTTGLTFSTVIPAPGSCYNDGALIEGVLYTGQPVLVSPDNLTSNSSADWILTANGEFNSTYAKYKAFDGDAGGYLLGWLSPETSVEEHYLQIKREAGPFQVNRYDIYAAYGTGDFMPLDFTFSGSTNGTDWVVLDTVVNADWGVFHPDAPLVRQLSSTANYQYYRLTVTAAGGINERREYPSSWYVGIGELKLYR